MSLYVPHRVIGYVTDGNPFVLNKLGTENFITMSVGEILLHNMHLFLIVLGSFCIFLSL